MATVPGSRPPDEFSNRTPACRGGVAAAAGLPGQPQASRFAAKVTVENPLVFSQSSHIRQVIDGISHFTGIFL